MSETIRDHDAIAMYERDMSLYSIVVNRRRAIPAIQDGLKPVQRRVVYGAYKLGLHGNKNDKSSALVGQIMGRLHPHGDCLRGSTVIQLADGNATTIKQLCEEGNPVKIIALNPVNGDIVRTIAHSFRIGQYTNKVYHIILDNEKEICCTNNHPFMVHGLKFIKAEDLKIGDELETKYTVINRLSLIMKRFKL